MKYVDFEGNVLEIENGQDKVLRILYTKPWGRLLLKGLVSPGISKMGGAILSSSFSKYAITPFIKKNQIDMHSYVKRDYQSFNDFFTREIKPEERMIDYQSAHLISPSDGRVSAYKIRKDSKFWIKHRYYDLETMVKSRRIARKYEEGYALVIRLTVNDYHRYCYPTEGKKSNNFLIPGCFHTVNPVACERVPVYHENTREYTLLRTKNMGDVLQMEVGALLVGKIYNYHEKSSVRKGEEKGRFEFGGSTIILLLEKDKVDLREDLLVNTKNECETLIRMGEVIGFEKPSRKNT